jgi:hypothetical protein
MTRSLLLATVRCVLDVPADVPEIERPMRRLGDAPTPPADDASGWEKDQ